MTRRRVRLLLDLPSGPENVVVSSSAEGWVVEGPGGSSRLDLADLPGGTLSPVFDGGRQVCGRVNAHDGAALLSTRRGIQRVAIDDPIRHRLPPPRSAPGAA